MSLAGLCAAAMFFAGPNARASIVGPYTADANTLHLWHLDETATPCIDSVASGGTNLVTLANGATLGNAAYAGFTNALNTTSTGLGKNAVLAAATSTSGNVVITVADTVSGAFTFEANVWIGFDPTTNGTGTFQILSGESGVNANRIFQWRILPKTATVAPLMTFENVRMAASGQGQSIQAAIPTTGPDAIAMSNWYHVAVSYNGQASTANNIKFYWTLLDPSRTAANQISIISATTTLSGLNPKATITTPFMVGNLGRNINGNFLGLIDEVRISKIERTAVQMMFTSTALSIITQPQSQFVAAGDTVTLSVVAGGESPRYQWQHSSTNLPSATNAVLVLTNIAFSQAGAYQVNITNSTSTTNSAVATITVGNLFSELFNTGLSDSRALLPGGAVDPHWLLTHSDDPNYPGPAEVVVGSPPGTYLANGPNSMWLAPVATGTAAGGNYTNRTTFLIETVDPSNAVLYGSWAMDNAGTDIQINGVSLGLTATGFGNFSSFTITNGFVLGLNTLDVAITNFPSAGSNPTGVRVELRGVALPLSNTPPLITGQPVNVTTQAQQNASFSVVVAGTGPLTYQWYHGATQLAGKTTRNLTLTSVATGDAGTYSVYVTNSLGWTNASATLTVVTPPALVWLGIDPISPTFWDMVTTNWLDTGASANVAFVPFDNVLFDDTGKTQPIVDLVLPLNPNAITVNAQTNYTFMSSGAAGALAGSAILIKNNTGTLILDTVNSNTGPTTVLGGTLQVGNGDANGALGSGAVSNNAALVFNRTDAFTVPNSISGTGSVTMAATGNLGLSGNSSYSGPTLVNAGTLTVRNSTALGSTNGGTTVASGSQLVIFGDVNLGAYPMTLSGMGVVGDGALRKAAGSGTIFGGPITMAADAGITVDSTATLALTNAAGITGTNVSLTLQGAGAGTISGPINLGTGALTEGGTGAWVLPNTNNNWSGGTTLNGGTLQIGDGGLDGSFGGGAVTVNSGTLSFVTALSLAITNPISNNGTLTFNSTGNLLVSGEISGGGAVNQNGADTVTLTGTNASYSGLTTLRTTAILRPGNSQALGTGICAIGSAQNDTCRLELLGGLTLVNPITIFSRAFGLLNNPADILNVSGTNIVSPPSSIVIPTGGNLLTLQSDSGMLSFASGVVAGPANNGRVLVLSGAASGEILGALGNNGGASSLKLYMLGAGTWTLWGTSSLGDPLADSGQAWTVISNGTLVVNGSLDSPLTNVLGTLSGTGVLSGPIVISSGATLAPGPGIGTLTVSNVLTLQPGSITSMEINKTDGTRDRVIGMTSVRYGGTLAVSLSGTPQLGDAFKLFDAASYSGTFASITPASPGGGLFWLTNTLTTDGTLRIQNASVSQPAIGSVVRADTNVLISGTSGAPWGGYSVVSSTNVTLPVATWGAVAFGAFDGSGQFSITIPIDPATPQRFFRVRAP